MSRRTVVALFEHEGDLLGAVKAARGSGHDVLEVFSPHPVHGLDEAMGLRPSRIPWACLVGGLLGAASGLGFQLWSSAVDWPLNVGGKPLDSTAAFVPVAFEMVILLAGLGAFAAFLLAARPWGRSRVPLPSPRVVDDRFALVLGARGAEFDADVVARLLVGQHGAVEVREELVREAS